MVFVQRGKARHPGSELGMLCRVFTGCTTAYRSFRSVERLVDTMDKSNMRRWAFPLILDEQANHLYLSSKSLISLAKRTKIYLNRLKLLA